MPTQLCQDIHALRAKGMTYDQIADQLQCSKSTVSYYIRPDGRQKTSDRRRRLRAKAHPFARKLESFAGIIQHGKRKPGVHNWKIRMKLKLETFCCGADMKYQKPTFTVDDIIAKVGEKPICYLTGDAIDIYDTKSYHFDHIVPRARGGLNTLENLEICKREANFAKRDMSLEDFVSMCQKIVDKHG